MLSITQILTLMAFWYVEPVLSFRIQQFTDSVRIQGIVFSCLVIGYCIMWFILPFFAKYVNQTGLITISLFLCGLFNFLVGPSTVLPDNLYLLAFGLLASSSTIAIVVVLQIPIMTKRAEWKYPSQTRRVSDMWCSIFSGTFSLGLLIGPIYGGYVNDLVGYRNLCDISATILVLYSLIFYAFYKLTEKSDEKSDDLQETQLKKAYLSEI